MKGSPTEMDQLMLSRAWATPTLDNATTAAAARIKRVFMLCLLTHRCGVPVFNVAAQADG